MTEGRKRSATIPQKFRIAFMRTLITTVEDAMRARTRSLALVVPSRMALVDEACEMVSGFFSNLGFDEDEIYAFDLSIREGIINAMKHGIHWNELLLVSVCVDVIGDDCVIQIRDSGTYQTSIPKAGGALLAPNGRG
jgi:anti-sigma regulatory factor (Ser/Thr protein kinase)